MKRPRKVTPFAVHYQDAAGIKRKDVVPALTPARAWAAVLATSPGALSLKVKVHKGGE